MILGKFGKVRASLGKSGQVESIRAIEQNKGTQGKLREEETSRELQIAKKREYKLSWEKKKEEEKVGSRIR